MSGFRSDWLDLREPADAEARDKALLAAAAALVDPARPVILDLGCGTGATRRAFGAAEGIAWRLVDDDPALLSEARRRCRDEAEFLRQDLSDLDRLPVDGAGLVTASALFDLVSAPWTDALCAMLAAAGTPLYAALTYDGRTDWKPAHPFDAEVLAAFNRHQRGDKGFGPALGPAATAHLQAALSRHGFKVTIAPSPWHLGPAEVELKVALARGMAEAAREAGTDADEADRWLADRIRLAPESECEVGHHDLLAAPPFRTKLQSNSTSVPR